ncbi:hypothetical protein [Kaarinaea lacus]
MAEAKTFSTETDQPFNDSRTRELTSAEELLGEPEPWESWESKLVIYSIGIAMVGLVILGYLVNTFILS